MSDEREVPQPPLQRPRQSILAPRGHRIVDLIFCIDGTSSMKGCLDAVKQRLVDVVQKELPKVPAATDADIRYRLVIFRDVLNDQVRQIEDHDFTDLEQFVRQVGGVTAEGGGDEDESALDAIVVALKAGEKNPARAFRNEARKGIVVLTDAPSHPEVAPATRTQYGLEELNMNGSAADVGSLLMTQRPFLFLAAPTVGRIEGHENTAFAELEKIPGVKWLAAEAESLKDLDMREYLLTMFKTVTAPAAMPTQVVS
jgi:von Willebrand factor type A domain